MVITLLTLALVVILMLPEDYIETHAQRITVIIIHTFQQVSIIQILKYMIQKITNGAEIVKLKKMQAGNIT